MIDEDIASRKDIRIQWIPWHVDVAQSLPQTIEIVENPMMRERKQLCN